MNILIEITAIVFLIYELYIGIKNEIDKHK